MSRKRHRLTSAQREQLWDDECAKANGAGRGQFPICAICGNGIFPGQKWHESHNRYLPHAIGGDPDGIAHERCNLEHNHRHDTPLIAKVKRVRQKHIGAHRRSGPPMIGSRASGWKHRMNGEWVRR